MTVGKPMKLVLVIEHFDATAGGAEGFAVGLLRRLVARGHAIEVVALDGVALDGVALHLGPLAATAARVAAMFEPDLVIDWGLQVSADIHRLGGGTHREYLRLSQAGRSLFGWCARRLVQTLSPRHRRIIAREHDLLTEPRTHVLAVSEFVAQQVRNTARVPLERIRVLHNGVDTTRFAPATPSSSLRHTVRSELELADDDVVFLFVGHNLTLKNLALCERVFRKLHADLPQARLVVVGKRDPVWDTPWGRYAGAGQPERFHAAADALLHPTYFDACANVVLEALASGLPVVSSDRNGSAELITPGQDGLVLPVCGSAETVLGQWCDAVRRLATDAALRQRLGAAARRVAENHDLERYATEFEAYLAQCLASKRKGNKAAS